MKKSLYAIITIILFISLCSFSECYGRREGHEYITVINESDDTICWQVHAFKGMTDADTVYLKNRGYEFVPSHSIINFPSSDYFWENTFDGYDYSGIAYEQWLVMDWKKFKEYRDSSEAVIREKVPVLKIWRFTLEDLEKCNWTVTYPSYPSYKFIEREY